MASKCSGEKKSHMSFTLPSEEACASNISQKLGLFCAKELAQVVHAKEKFLKKIKSATPGNT